MFWAGFAIKIFLGATIGMVLASLLAASARDDDEEYWGRATADIAVMDEVKPAPVNVTDTPRPPTFLDEYPYS